MGTLKDILMREGLKCERNRCLRKRMCDCMRLEARVPGLDRDLWAILGSPSSNSSSRKLTGWQSQDGGKEGRK